MRVRNRQPGAASQGNAAARRQTICYERLTSGDISPARDSLLIPGSAQQLRVPAA